MTDKKNYIPKIPSHFQAGAFLSRSQAPAWEREKFFVSYILRFTAAGIIALKMLALIGWLMFIAPQEISAEDTIPFEIYPKEKSPYCKPVPEPVLSLTPPKAAIIIDDIGYDKRVAEKILSLDADITFSVLPQSPFGNQIIRQIKAKGRELMIHLPMEPLEYPDINPGTEAIFADMPPDEILSALNENLEAIPFAVGVNNHMGSRITTNASLMYQILSVFKKKGLFFIDSFTTTDSVCKSSARVLQIPFAQRDVFLDHIQSSDAIRRQIKLLIRVAASYGEAVGIGHPHAVTYNVLCEMLPELNKKIQIVPASEIVHNQ